ncbi:MAG: DUF3307 domain-containing protein [Clostridiales bacterium]|nr:DUF3307 domain-containing protein [Clostridiales bacterium]
MYSNLLISFIILHVLGDYYLQTDTIIEKKVTKYRYVLLQSIIYAAVFFAGTIIIWSQETAIAALVLSLWHFIIDSTKHIFQKKNNHVSG